MRPFADVIVIAPLRYKNLSVYPLYAEQQPEVMYELAADAMSSGSVIVEEIGRGQVSRIAARNEGSSCVLFFEGEELRGAKQDRVVNATVLIGANSRASLPVSCVEQQRWRQVSPRFQGGDSHCTPAIRSAVKSSVDDSVVLGRGHHSDQGTVWTSVSDTLDSVDVASETMAMSSAFTRLKHRIARYQRELAYFTGSNGLAIAIAGRTVSVDLFDKPATCAMLWPRILAGCVVDALGKRSKPAAPDLSEIVYLLEAANRAKWRGVKPAGLGEEWRAVVGKMHASALFYQQSLIHASIVIAAR